MSLPDEGPFRVAFGIFWVLNFLLRVYFQVAARGSHNSFTRNQGQAKLGFRLLAIAYILLLFYCCSTWFDSAHVDLPSWVRWSFGGATLMLYVLLFGWTHRSLGKHWSGMLEIHQDHVLVTDGPYRYVRHPMYSAFFLSGIGIFLFSANWFVSGLYLVAVTFMYSIRVSSEEQMMIEGFGDAYREYMKRTGRLIPLYHPKSRTGSQPHET